METRALAIAFFYAVGTGLGGIVGPLLFGHLIATLDRTLVMLAFLIGAGVMALGGVAEIFLGVRAEQAALEDVAKPLTAEEAEQEGDGGERGEEQEAADRPTSREREETERRWRERQEHRRQRERAGLRRYRPGPGAGESFYSPGMVGTALHTREASPGVLDREIDAIARSLAEQGPAGRDELARLVGARRWGPGRFQRALGEAAAAGRIRRVSRNRYEAVGEET
jgi:hypothetical protein